MQVAGTHGQSSNPEWFKQRDGVISASRVGKVLKLFKPYHIEELLDVNKQDEKARCMEKLAPILYPVRGHGYGASCEAVSWGICNEHVALACYKVECEKRGLHVSQTGLWRDKTHPWLCCSPDGIVSDRTYPLGASDSFKFTPGSILLEIKCPYSLRHSPRSVRYHAEMKGGKGWYLKVGRVWPKDPTRLPRLLLNLDHPQGWYYWHQVQSSMHILDLEVCHFVVWKPVTGIEIVVVERDPCWKNVFLPRLEFIMNNVMTEKNKTPSHA